MLLVGQQEGHAVCKNYSATAVLLAHHHNLVAALKKVKG